MHFLFKWIPARVIFAIVGCLAIVNVYTLRVNLSVALVSMVNSSAITKQNASNECEVTNSNSTESTSQDGEFVWDEYTQGIILGSFFWGYIITQLPGGRIAEMFSGKWVIGIGIVSTAIFTLLTPIAARAGYWYLIVIRVLEGLGEGVTFPAFHAMTSRWSPPVERTRIVTIIFSGSLLGTVIGMSLSGLLAELWDWPSIFYIFGIAGIVWFLFWVLLVYDSPSQHPWISLEERLYIEESLSVKSDEKPRHPPWKEIAKSLPVWAIIVSHFCQNWGFYTLLTELPTYLSNILKYDMKKDSFISALPYLSCWIFSCCVGFISDFLIKRNYITVTVARKSFNFLGKLAPAIFLFAITFTHCNKGLVLTFLILGMTLNGGIYSGFNCNHIDIAPRYAGTLLGISNCVATLPGILGPYVAGALTNGQSTQNQWAKVFYISSALYLFSAIFFAIFGSGKEQSWNKIDTKEDKEWLTNQKSSKEDAIWTTYQTI